MKSITIGVTVNLDRYENLRVDVTDDDPDRAIDLVCETLDRLGRSDPETSAAIDSYRRRVFGVRESAQTPAHTHREAPGDAEDRVPEQIATSPIPEHTPPETPTQNGNMEWAVDPAKLDRVCSRCGTALTEADAVSSALFNGGTVVCRKCRYPGLESSKQAPPPLETTEPVCVVCGLSALNTGGLSAGGKCAACLEFDGKSEAAKPKPTQTPKKPPITKQTVETAVKDPTAAPTYVCAECGVEIARVQHDVSQLFNNRDLCKACMKQQPKERAA